MIIRGAEHIRPSEITPYGAYLNRRQLIGAGAGLSLGSLLVQTVRADTIAAAKSPLSTDEERKMEELAAKSLVEQVEVESRDTESFDAFVAAYQVYQPKSASV